MDCLFAMREPPAGLGLNGSTLQRVVGNQIIDRANAQVEAARKAGNPALEASALLDLGRVYAAAGLTVEASGAFEDAVTPARAASDQPLLAKALANAGSQLHLAGQPGEALELTEQALVEFRGLGDKRNELRTLANCAAIQQALGLAADAAVTAEKAITVARELDDRELLYPLHSLHADLLTGLERATQARSARRQALTAARKTDNTEFISTQLEALGELLLIDEAHDEALKLYFEANALHTKRGDVAGTYRTLLQQGLLYQHLGRWAEAESALRGALELCQQLSDAPHEPYIQASLASAHLSTGKFEAAATLATAAAEGYRRSEDPIGVGRALASLGQAQEQLGDDASARRNFEEALGMLSGVDPAGEDALRSLLAL